MISYNLADFIRLIHILLILFILIGWTLPIQYLHYYILLIIIVLMDWNDLDGQCILTRLEHYFRTGQWSQQPPQEEGAPEFFRPIFMKITGLQISRLGADRLNNFLFLICLLIAFYRIFLKL